MLFVEPRFLPFFLAAFGIYWLARGQDSRKAWLLLCSYAFYAAWDYRFLSLIFVSTAVDFSVGLGLARTSNPVRRKRLVMTSLAVNLGILGVFKYFDFFAGSLAELLVITGGWFLAPEAATSVAAPMARATSNTHALGEIIYTRYVYLFQAAGLVLLVAMIGAITLTSRSRPGLRRQNISQQVSRSREDSVEILKVPIGGGI